MPPLIAIDARKQRDFGIGTYVRALIRELAELDDGGRYALLVRPGDRGALGDLPAGFVESPEAAPGYSLRETLAVSSHLRRLGADLYHATHYTVPWRPPCPTVVTVHDVIHLLFPEFLPHRLALHYARLMLRRATRGSRRIITVSGATRDDLIRVVGADPARIRVVHNGVARRFFERPDDDQLARRLSALGLRPPYLLYVGNPKPHKNVPRLLDAYARAEALAERALPPLVLAGAGAAEQEELRSAARRRGLEGSLTLLGVVGDDDLPALYRGAELFVYPSLYEGFGLPVIEAMASGTAVVTSRCSALEEVAGEAAELVDPRDPDDIAAAIVRCLTDEQRRRELVERGRRRAGTFGWERTAAATLAVYREALEEAA